jgi:hypothetical protein
MNAWLVVLAVYKFRAQPSLFLIKPGISPPENNPNEFLLCG